MTGPYHQATAEVHPLSATLITQLQHLFYEKYGVRPSGAYWITPVYNTKLQSTKKSTTAPALLFGRLEQFFLDDDLRRTIPPLLPPSANGDANEVLTPPIQYYYQNHGEDRFREQDLVSCVKGSNFVPDGIASMRSATITGPVTFQIADVQEIGISRSEQVRKIEEGMCDSGDSGRKVVRDVPADVDDAVEIDASGRVPSGTAMASGVQFHTFNGTQPGKTRTPIFGKKICKVLLQDTLGRCYWALESKPINDLEVGLKLGTKITLNNVTVLRGVIMLKPTSVILRGGAIDEWNTEYIVKLMSRLKREIGHGENNPPGPRNGGTTVATPQPDPEIIADDDDDNYIDDDLDDADFEDL
ncbi:hypothetical protein V1506DRAFT_532092 [Lipomyces tetrasporus]